MTQENPLIQNFETSDNSADPAGAPERDHWLWGMAAVNLLGLGGFLLWSCFAPLAEGVITTGQIIADTEVQTVQHLEGGIISVLHVKEGDHVLQGDTLIELDTTASEARWDQITLQHDTALLGVERIRSLLQGRGEISIAHIDWLVSEPVADTIYAQQKALFESQRFARLQERELLAARKSSLRVGIEGREKEILAVEISRDEVDKEISLLEGLLEQQLARRDELHRLVRQKAALEAELAQLQVQIEELRSQILEVDQQLLQGRAAFEETLSLELIEANATLSASEQELKFLEDTLTRTAVTAPVSGEILNLQFATLGGVIRPGQSILEIVPKSTGLWATLRVQPNDREAVYAGLEVKARLAAFKSWQSPTIIGNVSTISADLKTLPESGLSYYEARIKFDVDDFSDHQINLVAPGMPVEAFIVSGVERTFMDYALEPIVAHFSKGLSGG